MSATIKKSLPKGKELNVNVKSIADVGREDKWGDEKKEEALDLLSSIPNSTDQREALQKMRAEAEEKVTELSKIFGMAIQDTQIPLKFVMSA